MSSWARISAVGSRADTVHVVLGRLVGGTGLQPVCVLNRSVTSAVTLLYGPGVQCLNPKSDKNA